MKFLKYGAVILALCLSACTGTNKHETSTIKRDTITRPDSLKVSNPVNNTTNNDKEEIQNLIRQTLKWSESEKNFDLIPVLTDSKDSICTRFDLNKLKVNLERLKRTNFFSADFIENYNQLF